MTQNPGERGLCPLGLPCHPLLSPSLDRRRMCVQTGGAQTRLGDTTLAERHVEVSVRGQGCGPTTHPLYTPAQTARQRHSLETPGYPRAQKLSKANFGHLMSHAGSIWFTHLPQRRPEKDALNLISPCQAVGLGRQSFSIYSQMTDPQGAGQSPLRSPILSEGWGESGGPGGQWRLWGLHSIHLPRGI